MQMHLQVLSLEGGNPLNLCLVASQPPFVHQWLPISCIAGNIWNIQALLEILDIMLQGGKEGGNI